MTNTCCIFGAGEYGALSLRTEQVEGAFLIAADGGCAWLAEQGVTPHLAVGDFDSLGFVPAGIPVLKHPREKDDTDMMLAVREGLARGCTRFLLYGGLGGRLDHTLANLHILSYLAEEGCQGFLLGPGEIVTAVRNGSLTFSPAHSGTISVFAWSGPACGVTLSGLRYPLAKGELSPHYPLGVSNEFLGQEASVSVAEGTLLVLWTSFSGGELPACT